MTNNEQLKKKLKNENISKSMLQQTLVNTDIIARNSSASTRIGAYEARLLG